VAVKSTAKAEVAAVDKGSQPKATNNGPSTIPPPMPSKPSVTVVHHAYRHYRRHCHRNHDDHHRGTNQERRKYRNNVHFVRLVSEIANEKKTIERNGTISSTKSMNEDEVSKDKYLKKAAI
jgi:hypothetical protein